LVTTSSASASHSPLPSLQSLVTSYRLLTCEGYINAQSTHKMLNKAAQDGAAFARHGGGISYSDDFYLGIIGCTEGIDECYNGTSSSLPPGNEDANYKKLLARFLTSILPLEEMQVPYTKPMKTSDNSG
jgi:hypothetical protein